LEGKGVVTQDAGGLAQKGGATWSHVLIGERQDAIRTTRVSMAAADLIIGCDPIVVAGKETAMRMRAGRTHVALNSHAIPTAAFVTNANWENPAEACVSDVVKAVGLDGVGVFNADAAANQLMGDSIYTNPMMLGYAWQKGWIPLSHVSLQRAIELNAVAVDQNKAAFEWGRRAAHDASAFEKILNPGQVVAFTKRTSLDDMVAQRVEFLTAYQNAAYAQTYKDYVQKVRAVDETAGEKRLALTEAVARYLFKLMAYKDEYEVARLHTDRAFHDKVAALFEGDYKLNYHLAPPLLAKKNDKGELQKQKFGPVMLTGFKVLARLKGLRGTTWDVFGKSEERVQERALIADYRTSMDEVINALALTLPSAQAAARYQNALDVARIPEQIRGFGHVKARHLKVARQNWAAKLEQFRRPQVTDKAA
jgi:indolepyruvate ferredoxin oxidoreductase